MNKDEYLKALEAELNKHVTDDNDVLMSQARETIAYIDEDKLEKILGTPKFYAMELIDNDSVNILKKDKKLSSFIIKKILPYIVLLVISFFIIAMNPALFFTYFFVIGMVILIGRMIVLSRGIMEVSMMIAMLIAIVFVTPIDNINELSKNIIAAFLIIYSVSKIIYNIVVLFAFNKKALRSSYNEEENEIDISASFGTAHYKIKDTQKLSLNVSCVRVFLDISEIQNDLEIEVNSFFSEINLKIKNDMYIIDNSSITMGGNVFDLDNNKKYKEGYTITINGNLIGGVINTEA